MLCFAHQGEPYGHLRRNGRDISVPELARMVGDSSRAVARLLRELEENNVFSRTTSGTIYSRRQVRDEALRERRAAGGPLSLDHPNVPKGGGKDGRKDTLSPSLPRSLGGSPSSPSPSPASSPPPTQAEKRRASETTDHGGTGGHGSPPPAAFAPGAAPNGLPDHDPDNALEARLALRVHDLAERAGSDWHDVLAAVSSTPNGKHLTDIRGASPAWIEQSLRDADRFEADAVGAGEEG